MGKNILWTIGSKAGIGIMNLLILILTAQMLGADGRGIISMFMLNIALIALVNELIGGSGLVYLIPRHRSGELLPLSYLWAFSSGIFVSSFLVFFNLMEREYWIHLLILSCIQNILSVNLYVLTGKEKIKEGNMLSLLQVFLLLAFLGVFFFVFHQKNISGFLMSLYVSYGIAMIASFFFLNLKELFQQPVISRKILKEISGYGFYIQIGNIAQWLSYRLSYYFLNAFHTKSDVGVFSAGTSITESVWIVGNSFSKVQYARISNSTDEKYSQKISVILSKFSFLISLVILIIIAALPEKFYLFFLGKEFTTIKLSIFSLFIGVLSVSFSIMYSHYFSGIGKMRISTMSALVGLAVAMIAGYFLIPKYGLVAAGIVCSISYLVNSVFLVVAFLRTTGYSSALLLLTKDDLSFFFGEIKKLYVRNSRSNIL